MSPPCRTDFDPPPAGNHRAQVWLRRTRRPPPPVSQPSFLTALFIAHIKLPIKSAPTDLARNCYVLESTQATAIMEIYTVQKGIKINPIVLLNPFLSLTHYHDKDPEQLPHRRPRLRPEVGAVEGGGAAELAEELEGGLGEGVPAAGGSGGRKRRLVGVA